LRPVGESPASWTGVKRTSRPFKRMNRGRAGRNLGRVTGRLEVFSRLCPVTRL
jgi:hypothetical protein